MILFTGLPHVLESIDLPGQVHHTGRPKNRLEHERQLLEYKKMNHADLMHYYPMDTRLNADLERRRQQIEARGGQPSMGVRIRHSLGQILIAAGERIRPETTVVERMPNA